MRPVELRIKAFGPFADEQTVDFSALCGRSLFLIHGPTGSGKTSILDAICFALYGQTSVSDRQSGFLRSHHADVSVPTEVSLTFNLGTTTYRVERIPEQTRPKSRGEGFTKQTATAILFRKKELSGEEPWEILADRWNRVTEKIEDILGFKCDQFRQVVMLPQGEFRKLLNASSQEKQAILAVLFKTDKYKYIEDSLKEKSRQIKQQYDQISGQITIHLKNCSCKSREELSALIDNLTRDLASAEEKRIVLQNLEEQLQSDLADKQQILSHFEELNTAEKELSRLQMQQESIQQSQNELENAQKALQIIPIENNLVKIRLDYQNCVKQVNHHQSELEKLRHVHSNLQKQHEEIPGLEKQRDELNVKLDMISKLIPKISRLDQARGEFRQKEQKANESRQLLTKEKLRLDSIKTALVKLHETLSVQREQAAAVELLKIQQREFSTRRTALQKIDGLCKEIEKLQQDVESRKSAFDQQCSRLEKKKETLEQMEELQYQYRAALLALTLQNNTPCPVCGSTDHPSPARSGQKLPDEKQISLLKQEIKKDELKKEQIRGETGKKEQNLIRLQNEHSLLKASSEQDEQSIEEIDKKLQGITSGLQLAEQATAKLKKCTEDIERGEKALTDSEKNVQDLTDALTVDLTSLSSAQTELKNLENEIPPEFNETNQVTAQQQLITKKISTISATIETMRRDLEKVLKDISTLEGTLNSGKERMTVLEIEQNDCSRRFNDELFSSKLTSESHYSQSKKSASEIASLREKIESFNRGFHSAKDRKNRAQSLCVDCEKPDIEQLQTRLKETKNQNTETISTISSIKNQLTQLEKTHTELTTLLENASHYEKEYGMAASLSEISTGNNSMRITFERFVLASLLDEVLSAGTHRLTIMSQNRYSLHRAKTHLDQRTSGGLDLMVFDSYTGISRPASSLSGGESFLAALSLALGLADVVQSHSGGIFLDTLFIDEGFGSLDAEALDCAFQALADIGHGGRLIGIISHVGELRERIDTRLELTHGKNGSAVSLNF
ncbi:MAG: AAA family ATPase [Chitinispirillaceae bacterium]|nr:AAA family ATPase [Chitinispirillaceae bacterium]